MIILQVLWWSCKSSLLVRALPCDREVMGSSPARGNLKDIQVREGILSLISGSGPMGARVYLFHGVPAHMVWPRLTSARWALLRQHTWAYQTEIKRGHTRCTGTPGNG
ncbi:hypothetical protein R6Q59_026576 [Mikania micrantha]